MEERFIVITGGPGSGKSTLLDELERRGYARTQEAGRGVIQEQVATGGDALPWGNRRKFAGKMLEWEMRSYEMAQRSEGPVLFDRGVVDVIGYLELIGEAVPEEMRRAAEEIRYHRRVLIAPPWEEIYAQDAERKQDFAEAVRTYEVMLSVYGRFGYALVELPKASVNERVEFVEAFVQERDGGGGSSRSSW